MQALPVKNSTAYPDSSSLRAGVGPTSFLARKCQQHRQRQQLLVRSSLTSEVAGRAAALFRQGSKAKRTSLIALISEAVSVNAAVQRFETLAGRSAMIGFVVAFLAEFNVPGEGLFGAWDGHSLSVFGASASFLIACAAVLASMSTRRVGKKLQGSVLSSLTALSTAVEGLDNNVDYVFEEVFGREFLSGIVNLDYDDFL